MTTEYCCLYLTQEYESQLQEVGEAAPNTEWKNQDFRMIDVDLNVSQFFSQYRWDI